MSNAVSTQIRDTYTALDEGQTPFTVAEIMHLAGPVRPLPVEEPHGPDRQWRMPLLVTSLAAAAVLVVLLLPALLGLATEDQTPATTPPTTQAQTVTTTAPTSTTPESALSETGSSGGVAWLPVSGTDPAPPLGEIGGEFVRVSNPMRYNYDTGVEPPVFIGAEPWGDDDRGWFYRSPDASTWTRERLAEFDGTSIRPSVEAGMLWVQSSDSNVDDGTLRSSADGVSWSTVEFDAGDGRVFVDPSPLTPYFPSTNGRRWVRIENTIIAPGRIAGGVEGSVWMSSNAGESFLKVEPFDAPHVAIQLGTIPEGFFVIGARADQLVVRASSTRGPDIVTYSTAFSPDGHTWISGEPIDIPTPEGNLGGWSPLDSAVEVRNGPIEDGGAAINYMIYNQYASGVAAGNGQVQSVVALEAGFRDGTIALAEIARAQPCPLNRYDDYPCIPSAGAIHQIHRTSEWLVASDRANFDNDPVTGLFLVWVSSDGIKWDLVPVDGLGDAATSGQVVIAGDSIFLWGPDSELWQLSQ